MNEVTRIRVCLFCKEDYEEPTWATDGSTLLKRPNLCDYCLEIEIYGGGLNWEEENSTAA